MKKQVVKFLDYEIVNTGNSDGWVITKEYDPKKDNLWECNLGNYDKLSEAKEDAFLQFLIARPKDFHAQVYHRLMGTKTCHEWYTFLEVLKRENIPMPDGIFESDDLGCTIETNFFNPDEVEVNDKLVSENPDNYYVVIKVNSKTFDVHVINHKTDSFVGALNGELKTIFTGYYKK